MSPYYRHEKDWTCGPVCARMILQSIGIKKTEKELAKFLNTNKKEGTRNRSFLELSEKYKLNYKVERNSNIEELKKSIKSGYKIIVGYYLESEKQGHLAVVRKIEKGYIHLLDPEFGPKTKYKIEYFLKIWKNDPKVDKEKRWFIGFK